MLSPARWVALGLTLSAAAIAPAHAAERCTGTLCDFYYGSSSPPPEEKPATRPAATPLMAPGGTLLGMFGGGGSKTAGNVDGTPQSHLHVQGGGLAAMARGEAPERCTGTLCDLFYGGPPPERPAAQPAAAAPVAVEADAGAPDETYAAPPRRAEPEPTPRCAYDARDPWRCYRR